MRVAAALLPLLACAFAPGAASPAPAGEIPPAAAESLDHVLLWTRNADAATSVLAVKLGFQVRPGGDFRDGVVNRLIRFADRTYLELLFFTRPRAELGEDARGDFDFLETGPGANSFGIEVADLDSTAASLRGRRFELLPETPPVYDPDGDGPLPSQESLWRTIAFGSRPLAASDFFFIRYRPPAAPNPEQQADREIFTRHPNGALRISAIWLLSGDAEAEAERLTRTGFGTPLPTSLPRIAASGFRFSAGRGSILVLQPQGPGSAADALAARGPHVFGLSIEVSDLGRARRIVERGYGKPVLPYAGLWGQAFAAPSEADLGLAIEFHEASTDRKAGEDR